MSPLVTETSCVVPHSGPQGPHAPGTNLGVVRMGR